MSDAYFDGMRDAGEYPPKGWGWGEPEYRAFSLLRRLSVALEDTEPYEIVEPWVKEELTRTSLELKEKYKYWKAM